MCDISFCLRARNVLINDYSMLKEKYPLNNSEFVRKKKFFNKEGDEIKHVILTLDEETDFTMVQSFIKDLPNGISHEFIVSVSTVEWTYMVDIPNFILELHHLVGGQMVFSFTSTYAIEIEEDDESSCPPPISDNNIYRK